MAILALIVLIGMAISHKSAQKYIDSGNSKQLSKQYDDAIKDYTKAIEIDSKNTEAYFQRANVYNLKGDKKNALKDYEKVMSLDLQGESGRKAIWIIRELKQDG